MLIIGVVRYMSDVRACWRNCVGERMAGLILGTMPFIIVLICLWIMWIPLRVIH